MVTAALNVRRCYLITVVVVRKSENLFNSDRSVAVVNIVVVVCACGSFVGRIVVVVVSNVVVRSG